MKFLGQCCRKLEHEEYRLTQTDRQTDRQTDATERITTAAFAGGNKIVLNFTIFVSIRGSPKGGWESNLPHFRKWGVDGLVISVTYF